LENRFKPEAQVLYLKVWKELDPDATIFSERTIEGALDHARKIGQEKSTEVEAPITGILHVVSGAIYIIECENSKYHLC
jgi:folylpolyglutamate synthase